MKIDRVMALLLPHKKDAIFNDYRYLSEIQQSTLLYRLANLKTSLIVFSTIPSLQVLH